MQCYAGFEPAVRELFRKHGSSKDVIVVANEQNFDMQTIIMHGRIWFHIYSFI